MKICELFHGFENDDWLQQKSILFLSSIQPYSNSKTYFILRGIVNSFILMNQIGLCGIYILFVAQNLKAVVDEWYCMDVRLYIGCDVVGTIDRVGMHSKFENFGSIFNLREFRHFRWLEIYLHITLIRG